MVFAENVLHICDTRGRSHFPAMLHHIHRIDLCTQRTTDGAVTIRYVLRDQSDAGLCRPNDGTVCRSLVRCGCT